MALSRRPSHLDWSGAATRASISGGVRNVTMRLSNRFGGDGENALDQQRVLGMTQRGLGEQ